jgi:hypothetical protein
MFYVTSIVLLALQVALAVHAVKSGRNMMWLFIILFFPLVGSLVYLFAEVIPEMERRNTVQVWVADIERFVSRLFSKY